MLSRKTKIALKLFANSIQSLIILVATVCSWGVFRGKELKSTAISDPDLDDRPFC